MPPAEQRRSRQGRYHLSDPFFRFYFRFNLEDSIACAELAVRQALDGISAKR